MAESAQLPSQYGGLVERLRYWQRYGFMTRMKDTIREAADALEQLGYVDPPAPPKVEPQPQPQPASAPARREPVWPGI